MSANFEEIARRLKDGTIVPFLGAAASTYARPDNYVWADDEGRAYPPTARELRDHLVERSIIPLLNHHDPTEDPDLAQTASRFLVGAEREELDEKIHDAVARCASPSPLHRYLADVASVTPLLFLTTNYDHLLEQALEAAGASYHLVVDMTAHLEHKG